MAGTMPNYVWVQADELRADALGCYGNDRWPAGQTPHIDGLADRGVRFDETYCNSPVCVPSRASMLTARYPTELQVLDNEGLYPNVEVSEEQSRSDKHVTFPELLSRAGYRTASLGKTHAPLRKVWDEVAHEPPRADGGYAAHHSTDKYVPPWDFVQLPGPPFLNLGGVYELGPREQTPTDDLTDMATTWLEANGSSAEPWLLRVSYLMPHTPVVPPRRLLDQFDINDFAYDEKLDRPTHPTSSYEALVAQAQRSDKLDAHQIAFARLCYWAVVTHLDEQIGRLLDVLGSVARPTVVMLDSDHGTMLGERGLWQKHVYARPVHRVPQIVSGPGLLPEGEVRHDPNSLIDRARTLLALSGLAPDPRMRGRDLFGPKPESPRVFSAIGAGDATSILYPLAQGGPQAPQRACVSDERFRYETNVRLGGRDLEADDPDADVCLIDRHADPNESCNVTGSTDLAEDERRLQRELQGWLQGTTPAT